MKGAAMTDKEAYKLIGERAVELSKRPEIQAKMIEIARTEGKKKAEKYLYMAAIASLAGSIDIL